MSITIATPGAHEGMDEAVYHGDPVTGGSLSASWAKQLVRPGGPAKWRHERLHGRPAKKEFDLGHAAHRLVLGVGADIVAIPDEYLSSNGTTSTKAAKEFIEQARANGAVPLKSTEVAQVEAMALQIVRSDAAMAVLEADGARHELSAFRTDERTGAWLRCRFDSIAPTVIGDYKTVGGADAADEISFNRAVHRLGYHQQAAWYLDMAHALDLVEDDAPFRFVLQEKDAPYLVNVVELDEDWLQLGRDANARAIDVWLDCLATEQWPGYGTHVKRLSPPLWLLEANAPTELDPAIEAELTALITRGA